MFIYNIQEILGFYKGVSIKYVRRLRGRGQIESHDISPEGEGGGSKNRQNHFK